MAHATVAVLPLPEFPQAFAESTPGEPSAEIPLQLCQYEYETRWGACDGQPCGRVATVHVLESEMDVCARHFEAVSRG